MDKMDKIGKVKDEKVAKVWIKGARSSMSQDPDPSEESGSEGFSGEIGEIVGNGKEDGGGVMNGNLSGGAHILNGNATQSSRNSITPVDSLAALLSAASLNDDATKVTDHHLVEDRGRGSRLRRGISKTSSVSDQPEPKKSVLLKNIGYDNSLARHASLDYIMNGPEEDLSENEGAVDLYDVMTLTKSYKDGVQSASQRSSVGNMYTEKLGVGEMNDIRPLSSPCPSSDDEASVHQTLDTSSSRSGSQSPSTQSMNVIDMRDLAPEAIPHGGGLMEGINELLPDVDFISSTDHDAVMHASSKGKQSHDLEQELGPEPVPERRISKSKSSDIHSFARSVTQFGSMFETDGTVMGVESQPKDTSCHNISHNQVTRSMPKSVPVPQMSQSAEVLGHFCHTSHHHTRATNTTHYDVSNKSRHPLPIHSHRPQTTQQLTHSHSQSIHHPIDFGTYGQSPHQRRAPAPHRQNVFPPAPQKSTSSIPSNLGSLEPNRRPASAHPTYHPPHVTNPDSNVPNLESHEAQNVPNEYFGDVASPIDEAYLSRLNFLDSMGAAHQMPHSEETVRAVRALYAAKKLRAKFVKPYTWHDSPVVLPPVVFSGDPWGTREPRFSIHSAPLMDDLDGFTKMEHGIVHVYLNSFDALNELPHVDTKAISESIKEKSGTTMTTPNGTTIMTMRSDSTLNTSSIVQEVAQVMDELRSANELEKEENGPKKLGSIDVSKFVPIHLTSTIPGFEEVLNALQALMVTVLDPAIKSFCWSRLQYLDTRFQMHLIYNGEAEQQECKSNSHRDFYNVRKVDTHVHHSACMTQKHLLRFIRRKYRTSGNEIVTKMRNADGTVKHLTLVDMFDQTIGMTAWDTSMDHLDVHAMQTCFHRFDVFNSKYNPFGQALLREVFLKTDNLIQGRYLAEMTKEVIGDLEDAKYQQVEWRISIYGHSKEEWAKLARWVLNNGLHSDRVRWVIQVPRLYHVYKRTGRVQNMSQLLENIFGPPIEAILHPEKHPEIYKFLHQVVAWDSVDDESLVSKFSTSSGNVPMPEHWDMPENPPYTYWMYFMYANIRSMNILLQARGLNAKAFRPHCGETGSISHLSICGLLSDGINHGIMLRKSPVLQYLYYTWQIGLAVSPLSNNALFHEIGKSPFPQLFKRGLNVSLSTDDPLMFHFTDEALLEEYSVCAHIWKLSPVDLCEMARNSVLQSNFEPQFKRHWIGSNYTFGGARGNDISCTNVPDLRLEYRYQTLRNERRLLKDIIAQGCNVNSV